MRIVCAQVALAAQQIMSGDAKIMIAGGQESMSLSAHCQYLRVAPKMGNVSLVDTMLSDGLTDAFSSYHLGITAENVAKAYGISRQQQDDFALESQQKAAAAQEVSLGLWEGRVLFAPRYMIGRH